MKFQKLNTFLLIILAKVILSSAEPMLTDEEKIIKGESSAFFGLRIKTEKIAEASKHLRNQLEIIETDYKKLGPKLAGMKVSLFDDVSSRFEDNFNDLNLNMSNVFYKIGITKDTFLNLKLPNYQDSDEYKKFKEQEAELRRINDSYKNLKKDIKRDLESIKQQKASNTEE